MNTSMVEAIENTPPMRGQMDLNQFIVLQLESQYRTIKLATDDLTDTQLYHQPTLDSNSIAWLMWHLSRWRDSVSAMVAGVPQVWVSAGWAARFGMSEARTGLGDAPAQVAAFRVDRERLFGYVDAAHRETVARVSQLTQAQFAQPVASLSGESRPAWQALAGMSGDSYQHAGQIAYLRGMITGHGWRQRVGMR
jgi:hypothetical protein